MAKSKSRPLSGVLALALAVSTAPATASIIAAPASHAVTFGSGPGQEWDEDYVSPNKRREIQRREQMRSEAGTEGARSRSRLNPETVEKLRQQGITCQGRVCSSAERIEMLDLTGLELTNVLFKDLDVGSIKSDSAKLNNSEFANLKVRDGWKAQDMVAKNLTISMAKGEAPEPLALEWINVSGGRMKISNADLKGAELGGKLALKSAQLTNCELTGKLVETMAAKGATSFLYSSITTGSSPRVFSEGTHLKNIDLRGSVIEGNLKNVTFENVNLTGSRIEVVRAQNVSIVGEQIKDLSIKSLEPSLDMRIEASIDRLRLEGQFERLDLSGTKLAPEADSFLEVANARLSELMLPRNINDSTFIKTEISNTRFPDRLSARNVQFEGLVATGSAGNQMGREINFSGSKLTDVDFSGNTFAEAKFTHTTLDNVSLEGAVITGKSSFDFSKIQDINLSNAVVEGRLEAKKTVWETIKGWFSKAQSIGLQGSTFGGLVDFSQATPESLAIVKWPDVVFTPGSEVVFKDPDSAEIAIRKILESNGVRSLENVPVGKLGTLPEANISFRDSSGQKRVLIKHGLTPNQIIERLSEIRTSNSTIEAKRGELATTMAEAERLGDVVLKLEASAPDLQAELNKINRERGRVSWEIVKLEEYKNEDSEEVKKEKLKNYRDRLTLLDETLIPEQEEKIEQNRRELSSARSALSRFNQNELANKANEVFDQMAEHEKVLVSHHDQLMTERTHKRAVSLEEARLQAEEAEQYLDVHERALERLHESTTQTKQAQEKAQSDLDARRAQSKSDPALSHRQASEINDLQNEIIEIDRKINDRRHLADSNMEIGRSIRGLSRDMEEAETSLREVRYERSRTLERMARARIDISHLQKVVEARQAEHEQAVKVEKDAIAEHAKAKNNVDHKKQAHQAEVASHESERGEPNQRLLEAAANRSAKNAEQERAKREEEKRKAAEAEHVRNEELKRHAEAEAKRLEELHENEKNRRIEEDKKRHDEEVRIEQERLEHIERQQREQELQKEQLENQRRQQEEFGKRNHEQSGGNRGKVV